MWIRTTESNKLDAECDHVTHAAAGFRDVFEESSDVLSCAAEQGNKTVLQQPDQSSSSAHR